MIKQIIAIVALSVTFIMAMAYAQQGLQALLAVHDWISDLLTNIFSGGEAGSITRELIALLAAPVIVGLVPAIIYWVVKRSWFPYFMEFVWVIWLIQTAALVILYKATVI